MEQAYIIGSACAAASGCYIACFGGKKSAGQHSFNKSYVLLQDCIRCCRRVADFPLFAPLLSREAVLRIIRKVEASIDVPGAVLDDRSVLGFLLSGLCLSAIFISMMCGSVFSGLLWIVICVAWCIYLDFRAQKRRKEAVLSAMPGIYRSLSAAIASGHTLAQAVEYVSSQGSGAAYGAFKRMSMRLSCGISTEEAVESLQKELRAPGSELLATALVVSHRTGSPLRELLLRSARLVERQEEYRRMISVKTAQVRLSVQIVCILPILMIVLLALISEDFMAGLSTFSGLVCVGLALVLDAVALLIIKHMVRGVL